MYNKTCSKCGEKFITNDVFQAHCKVCESAYAKVTRQLQKQILIQYTGCNSIGELCKH